MRTIVDEYYWMRKKDRRGKWGEGIKVVNKLPPDRHWPTDLQLIGPIYFYIMFVLKVMGGYR